MNKPHYSFFPVHPYHLHAAMSFYFPMRRISSDDNIEYRGKYKGTCEALENTIGSFPKISMSLIEEYCETALHFISDVARKCRIDLKDRLQISHDRLLDVIIYANIHDDYMEHWENRIVNREKDWVSNVSNNQLLNMAEQLREAIEDNIIPQDGYRPSNHSDEYPDAYERTNDELNGDFGDD